VEYLPNLAGMAAILLLAYVSPGPDFVAVSSRALSGRKAGVLTALGVAAGCTVWSLMAVFGLGLFIARLSWLYALVRLGGAAYLVLLGLRMILAARRGAPEPAPARTAEPSAATGGHLRTGFLVNMTNPKAVVFFGSLLVAVLPVHAPAWVYCATVALVGGLAVAWFTAVALLFSSGRVRRAYARIRRPADALMGAALVGLGARLAVSR
jgi:RhtB (resistance to homoserine/threonine) family protein